MGGVPATQIVLRVRENPEFDKLFLEDTEADWRYISWWNNKVCFVDGCNNDAEQCEVTFGEGHVTHSLLSQAITPPICSESAHLKTTMHTQDVIEFIDTIKKTLCLLRLFSFS